MPRSPRVPSYRLHKPTGQAVVTLAGRDYYLGKHGSEGSREKYRRLLAEHLAGRPVGGTQPAASCRDVLAQYERHAAAYYRKGGVATSEVAAIRSALRFVVDLFGSTAVGDFGVRELRVAREAMIDADQSRGVVNQNVGRIVRAFRWAVVEGLYSGEALAELRSLPGLRKGRTRAREAAPVEPVDDAVVDATIPHLPTVVAAMVRFQRATGCRPSEVCRLRPCDLDRSSDVWRYRLDSHKTEHHGRERVVYIGTKGQDVLRPFLLRPEDHYCFRPDRAQAVPLREKRYSREAYTRAVARGCEVAGVDQWSPNQLRHTFATEARRRFGLEAAQVLLGHASANVTQVYAERDAAKAIEAARLIG